MAEETADVRLELKWLPTAEPMSAEFVEHMLIGNRGEYYMLTLGQTVEPVSPPNGAEKIAEAIENGALGIRPVARFIVPRGKMEEWARVLGRFVSDSEALREDSPDASN